MYVFNLAQRFRQVSEKYGTKPALRFPDGEQWYYEDLDVASNRVAAFMERHGLERGRVVAVSGKKSFFTFSVIFACLKSGVAYTVFDPQSPMERLYKIFNVCQPKMIFANRETCAVLAQRLEKDTHLVSLQLNDMPEGKEWTRAQDFPANTPAYIMFTSGSTGTPKGAVITHGNLLNFIDWAGEAFNIQHTDIVTNVNPLYFDNSVFDLYGALFNGASLVPLDREWLTNAARLVGVVERMGCTQWFSVPTMLIFLQTMKVLNRDSFPALKRMIFGGEGYPKARLKKLFELFEGRIDLYNVYGPTECTCICSQYRISAADFEELNGFPPLGSIIPNFGWAILDDQGREAAAGESGELCLTGPCVGHGYYNDPDNTERHFIYNPLNMNFPEIMYKTGDLVRLDKEDGKLYILGRRDNQVKHMGYRIELEEIETALCRLDHVSQALVIHGAARGLSRLVAVVCGGEDITETALRDGLKKLLPDYMIPNEFHTVRQLPVNANGKVNRKKVSEIYLSEKRNAS